MMRLTLVRLGAVARETQAPFQVFIAGGAPPRCRTWSSDWIPRRGSVIRLGSNGWPGVPATARAK